MSVSLAPAPGDGTRFFIRLDGRHAGGVTVHSVCGDAFSYGIAVAPEMRRRGAAEAGLSLLFERMRAQGFRRVFARIEEGNAASLALHRKLGFRETGREGGVVCMERAL